MGGGVFDLCTWVEMPQKSEARVCKAEFESVYMLEHVCKRFEAFLKLCLGCLEDTKFEVAISDLIYILQ